MENDAVNEEEKEDGGDVAEAGVLSPDEINELRDSQSQQSQQSNAEYKSGIVSEGEGVNRDSSGESVSGDRSGINVGGDRQSEIVAGDRSGISVGGDRQSEIVTGDRSGISVGGDRQSEIVTGDRSGMSVGGDRQSEIVAGDRSGISVGGDRQSEIVGGDRQSEIVTGDRSALSVGDDRPRVNFADDLLGEDIARDRSVTNVQNKNMADEQRKGHDEDDAKEIQHSAEKALEEEFPDENIKEADYDGPSHGGREGSEGLEEKEIDDELASNVSGVPSKPTNSRVQLQEPVTGRPPSKAALQDLKFKEESDWRSEVNYPLPPVEPPSRRGSPRLHQWSYQRNNPLLRNPFFEPVPVCRKVCCAPGQGLTTTRYSGPDRRKSVSERRWARNQCLEDRRVASTLLRPNPATAIPMRRRKWKPMTWMDPKEDVQQWKVKADQEKARKDREKSQKLGYETLVGNLVYYNIPGAKDLNRSWKHFLDPDPMAWGFPYSRGSKEKPCLPLPSPYLVHQMREQLWKYPRNKLIVHSNSPPTVPIPNDEAP